MVLRGCCGDFLQGASGNSSTCSLITGGGATTGCELWLRLTFLRVASLGEAGMWAALAEASPLRQGTSCATTVPPPPATPTETPETFTPAEGAPLETLGPNLPTGTVFPPLPGVGATCSPPTTGNAPPGLILPSLPVRTVTMSERCCRGCA